MKKLILPAILLLLVSLAATETYSKTMTGMARPPGGAIAAAIQTPATLSETEYIDFQAVATEALSEAVTLPTFHLPPVALTARAASVTKDEQEVFRSCTGTNVSLRIDTFTSKSRSCKSTAFTDRKNPYYLKRYPDADPKRTRRN